MEISHAKALALRLAFNNIITYIYHHIINNIIYISTLYIFKDFIHLFLDRGEGGRKRERNFNVWLPLICPLPGT